MIKKEDFFNIENFFKKTDGDKPLQLMPGLTQETQLIHRGVLSSDMQLYYYTVSDTGFSKFDVKCVNMIDGADAEEAFFNSEYSEHGVSFSPDGTTLFFSSTRPVDCDGVQDTWHIWRSVKQGDTWGAAEFVDIPNLRGKLLSHPTVTKDGTLYFHASELDYSGMDLYFSRLVNGSYSDAQKVDIPDGEVSKCTPYISPDDTYLIYAAIGAQLDLYICYRKGNNIWSEPQKLPAEINQQGQGNPVVTPDGKYLLYAKENSKDNWGIFAVPLETFLA